MKKILSLALVLAMLLCAFASCGKKEVSELDENGMYMDNAEGKISDDRLARVVPDLEKEASTLEAKIAELDVDDPADEIQESYERFFALAKQYTYIETLDRDTLVTFIDRIEVGEKILPEGYEKMPRKNAKYQQRIRIFYKFIGEIANEPVREMAPAGLKTETIPSTGEV